MGYAFFILQLTNLLDREFAGLVADTKIDFILGGGDDFVDGRLDVQQDQPVRLPGIVRYVHELVTVFRHRNAAVLRKIEEIVDLLFALGIDTLYSPGLVADADDNGSAFGIGVSADDVRELGRFLLGADLTS